MLTIKKSISKALNITNVILVVMFLNSCGTTHKIKQNFKQIDNENSFFKGFVLYNPTTKKELINYNGQKYFIPASNTKLFTFYTAYKTLEDSITGLEYYKTQDSILIKGTADPSLLHSFETSKVIDFLKKQTDSIYLIDENINDNSLGSGWAWDDYQYYYMPEKSLFPVHGNLVKYTINDRLQNSVPSYFKQNIHVLDSVSITREFSKNIFYIQKNSKKVNNVPFITSNQLVAKLLSDEIQKEIKLISTSKEYNFKTLKSVTSDELYKQMLVESDNFIAEQLLLQVGKKVTNSYSVKSAINYSLINYLEGLPQVPRWVDGSGLSRYNLFSPNDFVYLLDKMYSEIPLPKLLNYLSDNDETDTLNPKIFVYAKSGSLSNNYNLSGYLITKKGTVLIFSYMNNHYQIPTSKIKNTIHKTLKLIYNNY